MISYSFTKQQIANYLINRSFLVNKASDIETVLDFYKCLQVDPINVLARSHELALWNRVENFKISDLYDELYEERSIFEYWMQLFSIIPIKFYPYFEPRRNIKGDWQDKYYENNKESIDLALEFVDANGVTSPKDLSHIPSGSSVFSWTSTSSRTALLEYLWDRGEVMIHHRKSNQKFYDITERVLNSNFEKKTLEECLDFILLSNFDYVGILRKTFFYRMGAYIRRFDLKNRFNEYLNDGRIIKVLIEGVKTTYYISAKRLSDIETLGKENHHDILNILSPLDPLVVDRTMLKDIFNFDYTWEAYTPPAKRKYGFYNMPILFNGAFVGQIYAIKKDGKIEVQSISTIEKSKEFKLLLKNKIKDLEKFINN